MPLECGFRSYHVYWKTKRGSRFEFLSYAFKELPVFISVLTERIKLPDLSVKTNTLLSGFG